MRRTILWLIIAQWAASAVWAAASSAGYLVYFGTYTGFRFTRKGDPNGHSHSQGIYVARFNPESGEVSEPRLAAEVRNPSFLAIHPNHRFLYSVVEDPLSVGPYRDKGSFVSAFSIDLNTGDLTRLNTVSSGGTSTCYISIDPSARFALVASFGSGSVSAFRLNEDGSLGERTAFHQHTGHGTDPLYQSQPHAHSIDVSPDRRFAVSADFGTDSLFVYRFDADSGSLNPNNPELLKILPAGAGPRHFVFSPDGRFAYLISEMSGKLTVFTWDGANGRLKELQSIDTLPSDAGKDKNVDALNPFRSAEVVLHPTGRFLYNSNRGSDTIAVFAVDPDKGTLSPVQQVSSRGLMPRHFAIDPTGSYLFAANQVSDGVVIFHVDGASGRITPTRTVVRVETPVWVGFVPVR